MTNIGISYAFLYDILSKLISKWRPLALDKVCIIIKFNKKIVIIKEEENLLADSFVSFDKHCRRVILEHWVFAGLNLPFTTQRRRSTNSTSTTQTTETTNLNATSLIKRNELESFGNLLK